MEVRKIRIDLTGQVFGRLTVLKRDIDRTPTGKRPRTYWLCQCECGNTISVQADNFKKGNTSSCGCLRKETTRANFYKNGLSYTPEYRSWVDMKHRCYKESDAHFRDYGGRGITVCNRWLKSVENFISDMGPRPSSKHTIDRIDNDGPYSPENCRWSNKYEQASNKRSNHLIIFNGETHTIREWSLITKLPYSTIQYRIESGWSVESALTQTVGKRVKK